MNALIIARDGRGRRIAQCDRKCYDAQGDSCRCICGGICHGLGLQAAARSALKADPAQIINSTLDTVPDAAHVSRHPNLSLWASPTLF